MLSVRPAQIKVFELEALRKFEDEMVAHSQSFAPRLCDVLGEEQLRVALRQAMKRADRHGFTFRGPIRLFIEMTFLFGSDFDTDPQYPWAARILGSPEDQMRRAETLCDHIVDYQEKVSGPEAAHTRRALEELTALTRTPPTWQPSGFVAGMLQELRRVFPQKAAYLGDAAITALLQEGRAVAQAHHFPSTRGESLVSTLMLVFGHGCADDPLYPWISRTLQDERLSDPGARLGRLETRAVTWLEHALAKPQERAQA